MRLKSAAAVIGLALAVGLAAENPAEASWCRGMPPGYCGGPFVAAPAVSHFVYYPQYYDIYYSATLLPDPYPAMYMPRGYWPRYERPYAAYGRRFWAPRRWCCGAPVVAVPPPRPVPVGLK